MSTNKWQISYSGYCCDTGFYSRVYTFDTYQEADDFHRSWCHDKTERGIGWSDGPDDMSPPYPEGVDPCEYFADEMAWWKQYLA